MNIQGWGLFQVLAFIVVVVVSVWAFKEIFPIIVKTFS